MPSYPDEPDIILEFPDRPRGFRLQRGYVLLGIVFLLFLVGHNAVPLYTDWLWFGEVGYRTVFTTTFLTRTCLYCGFGLAFFAIYYGNLALALRLAPEKSDRFLREHFGPMLVKTIQRSIGWGAFALAIFLSLWAGRIAAESWTSYLEFANWTAFGVHDPVFGNDIGFYLFRLPFLQFLWSFLLGTLALTLLTVLVLHVADGAVESWAHLPEAHPGVRRQLLALLAALAINQAFGTRLNCFALLTSDNAVFTGAGFADLHYRLLAFNVEIGFLVLTAFACLVTMPNGRNFRLPILGAAGWLGATLVLGALLPSVAQKLFVDPNQLAREQPYIARNIRFTRLGFGLQDVRRVDSFPADSSLTANQLRSNQDTLENVRLWDYAFIGRVYDQTQTLKRYYAFKQLNVDGSTGYNVDIDRYKIGGRQRQVMLAARELDATGLSQDARTWQNLRLGYTHGFGLVMSPVNKIVDGGPEYFLKDFPPVASSDAPELKVTQPDIYYGQLAHDYVFVDAAQQEYDPTVDVPGAVGKVAHVHPYIGRGGIRIGDAPLAKLAFSLQFGDQNVLLASNFKPETRVLFRRDIRERVQTVAPFVQQDGDPYLIVTDDGRLVWMIDCYTMSDRFPYSTPEILSVTAAEQVAPNYIRNSVKATVDAYDGSVNLYLADPTDPIARTYAKIFPGLLKPLEHMPSGLRAHIRYPEDLFRIQRSVYAMYHVDDPGVFYRKEDAWAIPVEPSADATANQSPQMEPYYVTMRLPDGTDGPGKSDLSEEFLIMSPLAPLKQEDKNILGWMCARCDTPHYGQLVLYKFPQERSVEGPSQIVSLVNSDPTISRELSLLRQSGSTASLGNLLVIPVEKSLLYIAPLYVEATTSAKLPQLQRVVVTFGQRAVMDKTLEAALARLFPGYEAGSQPAATTSPTPASSGTGGSVAITPSLRNLILNAAREYDAAQQKLKAGDFAGYGEATKRLQRTLDSLRSAAGLSPVRP